MRKKANTAIAAILILLLVLILSVGFYFAYNHFNKVSTNKTNDNSIVRYSKVLVHNNITYLHVVGLIEKDCNESESSSSDKYCALSPYRKFDDFKINKNEYVEREFKMNKTIKLYFSSPGYYVSSAVVPPTFIEKYDIDLSNSLVRIADVNVHQVNPLLIGQNTMTLNVSVTEGMIYNPRICVKRTANFIYFDLIKNMNDENYEVMDKADYPISDADNCWRIYDLSSPANTTTIYNLNFVYKLVDLREWDNVRINVIDSWKDLNEAENYPYLNKINYSDGRDLGLKNIELIIKN